MVEILEWRIAELRLGTANPTFHTRRATGKRIEDSMGALDTNGGETITIGLFDPA